MLSRIFPIVCFIAVMFLAFAADLHAETYVMKTDELVVTLGESGCASPVADMLPPELRGQFAAADVLWQGQPLRACWAQINPVEVLIVDETGDVGTLPVAAFSSKQVI